MPPCERKDGSYPNGEFKIDFLGSSLKWSNLGGTGPDLNASRPSIFFQNIGYYRSPDYTGYVDMEVRNLSTYIAHNTNVNGQSSRARFGIINVAGKSPCEYPETNDVKLSFDFTKAGTDQPIDLVFVQMTYFDMDSGRDDNDPTPGPTSDGAGPGAGVSACISGPCSGSTAYESSA